MVLEKLMYAQVICLAGAVLTAHFGRAQSPNSPVDDKDEPVPMKKLELSLLSNEDLLKQANAIYENASRNYLAQLRILASAEARLDDVRKQTPASPSMAIAIPCRRSSCARRSPSALAVMNCVYCTKARWWLSTCAVISVGNCSCCRSIAWLRSVAVSGHSGRR